MAELGERQAAKLARAARDSPVGILSVDHEGRVEWANVTCQRLLGSSVKEMVGRSVGSVIAGDGHGPGVEELALAPDATVRSRLAVQRRDGSQRTIDVSVVPVSAPPEELAGAILLLVDASDEAAMSSSVGALEARLALSFARGPVPQAFLDTDGRFLDVNDALCQLLETGPSALFGAFADAFLDPRDGHRVRRLLADSVARGDASVHCEAVARSAAGRELPLLMDFAILTGPDGAPAGAACVVRDVTEVHSVRQRLSEQAAFFRELSRRAWDIALVTTADAEVVYVSPSVTAILGYEPEELIFGSGWDFVHPESVAGAQELLRSALAEPSSPARAQLRVRDAADEWRWMEATVSNSLGDPQIGGLVVNLRDVTSRVATREALQRSEAHYRAILEASQEGILTLDEGDVVLFANEVLAEMIGLSLEQVYETGLWPALAPADAEDIHRRLGRCQDGVPLRCEVQMSARDGEHRTLSIAARPVADGDATHSLVTVADVTAERRTQEDLRRRALHDPLTGLPNRALMDDRITMAAARQARAGHRGLAVFFVDLDHLKRINDRSGHRFGDATLVEAARRLTAAVRDVDTVARLGGDEFAVLCEDLDSAGALEVGRRLQEAFVPPAVIDGQRVEVSASIGAALSPPVPADELLRSADTAMYVAKQQRRGSFLLFDAQMATATRRRIELVQDVRQVVDGQGLVLLYQPIVALDGVADPGDVPDVRVRGMEALCRWDHPRMGLMPAADLLTSARDAGLEAELDQQILARACRDMRRLLDDGVLTEDAYVSVNVCAQTAASVELDVVVPQAVAAAGLQPHHLVLELTESSMLADVERTAGALQRLAAAGIRTAVDDFGTGYSSLSYLHRLPLAILKIDRSFVSGMLNEPEAEAIVRSLLGLAEALELHTVAEGVETPEQAVALAGLGCDNGQGYVWSRPVRAEELGAVFAAAAR